MRRSYSAASLYRNKAVEVLAEQLSDMDTYWHALEVPAKGLAYDGVTLIPPASLDRFLAALKNREGVETLTALVRRAKRETVLLSILESVGMLPSRLVKTGDGRKRDPLYRKKIQR